MTMWHSANEDPISDPALIYKQVAARLTTLLDQRGMDTSVVPDLLGTIGWHAQVIGTERMLSPVLVAYGVGLSEQADRMRKAAP